MLPFDEADFPPEHLFRAVYDAVLDALQTQSLLPTKGESYISKEKAYLAADLELLDLLTSEQLSQIVNNDDAQWVFPNTTPENRNLWEYVKNHLVNLYSI